VEGDSRQANLRFSAPGLPVLPMGRANPLHLAADSDLVLDLADPLHLTHDDSDLILDSDSAIPDESGDDAGSESSKETALHAPLPNQSYHPKEGDAEDGGCHLVANHPCLHVIH
jgi:hypothetical protein